MATSAAVAGRSGAGFGARRTGYWMVMTTAGLVVLGVVVISALALIIVFIWLMDARRNEHVAHDEERVEQHSAERRDPRA